MPESRNVSAHLQYPRREQFRVQRDAALRSCGSPTSVLQRQGAPAPLGTIVMHDPAPGASASSGYLTVAGSVTHHLKLGCNSIGRQVDNDVVIADRTLRVSRRHCSIVVHTDGRAEVFDLASLNGTYLNGHRVVGGAPLRTNDVVKLGNDVAFTVVLYGPGER